MGEVGRVVQKESNSIVTISLTRTEACGKCRACIAGLQQNEMLMKAKNECHASVGDYVSIELKEGYFLKAVAIMYAWPLIALMVGFVVGYGAGNFLGLGQMKEVVGFLFGIFCLGISYFLIHKQDKKLKMKEFMPYAVEIVNPQEKQDNGN